MAEFSMSLPASRHHTLRLAPAPSTGKLVVYAAMAISLVISGLPSPAAPTRALRGFGACISRARSCSASATRRVFGV